MNLLIQIDDRIGRARTFVKEHGWGSLGSLLFHATMVVIVLTVMAGAVSNNSVPIPPIVILDTDSMKQAEPLEDKPLVGPETPDQDTTPDRLDESPVPPKTGEIEVLGDDLVGGVGGGSGNTGIGKGGTEDGLGFPVDGAPSPLVMPGLHEGPRVGGTNGLIGLILRNKGSRAGETAVLKALRWMKEKQNEDGAWPGTDSPTAMCGLALLCYMAHGETPASKEFGPTVEKAIRYLLNAQEANGRFRNAGANYAYGHAIATYALAESYGMTRMVMLKEAMEKAAQVIIDGQQSGGAFDYNYAKTARRDMSVTGWQVQALKAVKLAGADNERLDECMYKCVDGVKSFASPGGGFGYSGPDNSPTLAGAGILCLQFLGRAEDPLVTKAFEATGKMLPAWPAAGGTTYGWYYMTQARFQKDAPDGPMWKIWNRAMLPMLVKNQKPDGHWESGSTASACAVYDTTLCCLSLEVYYRYSLVMTRPDEGRRTPRTEDVADSQLVIITM